MWNPKIQSRIYKRYPIISIQCQINTISRTDTYLFFFILSSHLRPVIPRSLLPEVLLIKALKPLLSPSTGAMYLIKLNLIDLTNNYSDKKRSSDIREQLGVFKINYKLTQYEINWREHIQRMDDNRL